MTGMPEHAVPGTAFRQDCRYGSYGMSHNRQKAKYYAGHCNSLRFAHVLWHGFGKGTLARIYKVVDAYTLFVNTLVRTYSIFSQIDEMNSKKIAVHCAQLIVSTPQHLHIYVVCTDPPLQLQITSPHTACSVAIGPHFSSSVDDGPQFVTEAKSSHSLHGPQCPRLSSHFRFATHCSAVQSRLPTRGAWVET